MDLIDTVPPESHERHATDDDISIWKTQDVYTAYVFLDTDRDISPNVTAKDGSEIPNPLKDKRVREAMSLAINRDAIIERLLQGLAEPAGQLAGPTMVGFNRDLKPSPYDRRLSARVTRGDAAAGLYCHLTHQRSGRRDRRRADNST